MAEATVPIEWKPTKTENPTFVCRKCDSDNVWYWADPDDDHMDVHYHCRGCGRDWWFEGPDA